MSDEPIVIEDKNNVQLQNRQKINSKMLGKSMLHINSTHSDQERLNFYKQRNSCFDTDPPEKPQHLNWNLRPRNKENELNPHAFTMKTHNSF
jgi:hypothetical protein